MVGIDLHIHTTFSDGTLTPKEILDKAEELKIPAIAITDHDTTDGVIDIAKYLGNTNVKVVPGIELSTRLNKTDIHILGYYPDMKSNYFLDKLNEIQIDRISRNKKMVDLMREQGVDIDYKSFIEEYPNLVITRASFGAYLMKHGYVKSVTEAFKKYIGNGCPCYIPRKHMSPLEGVRFLQKSGALIYIAHPGLYNFSDSEFNEILDELIPEGLVGIECYHSSHTDEQIAKYREIAKQHHLLTSGGSDFHGTNKPDISLATGRGNLYVPYHLYEQLKAMEDERKSISN